MSRPSIALLLGAVTRDLWREHGSERTGAGGGVHYAGLALSRLGRARARRDTTPQLRSRRGGARAVSLVERARCTEVPIRPARVQDPRAKTGAGDTFLACYSWQRTLGAKLEHGELPTGIALHAAIGKASEELTP